MRVLVLGATGFVGRALTLALQARDHEVVVLARNPASAARLLPADTRAVGFTVNAALDEALASADAVVNLAGESIAGKRWTASRKRELTSSRIDTAERLNAALARRARPLPVLISASASGWYGDRGDEPLDERSIGGTGFAAQLCRAWEATAMRARAERIVLTRFGVVLGPEGGALAALRPVYRFGLGGPIGDGAAWFPWIHLEDAARAIVHALETAEIAGPIAVAAPGVVHQREFAQTYAHHLHRPGFLRTPTLAMRAALGEAASIVTSSQRLLPRELLMHRFEFLFPTLDGALADICDSSVTIEAAGDLPVSDYLRDRGARYVLRASTVLPVPLRDVFPFFSAPENLAVLTPPQLGLQINRDERVVMRTDAEMAYRIHLGPIPFRWKTRIEVWEPGKRFVDTQLAGPYRSWWHEHRFTDRGGETLMEDNVYFSPPLGGLGRLVVEDRLRRIFAYRHTAVRLRFAPTSAQDAPRQTEHAR